MTDQDRICTCCGEPTYYYRWLYAAYICEECYRLLPRTMGTSIRAQMQFVRLIQQVARLTHKVIEQDERLQKLEGQINGQEVERPQRPQADDA
jgi:hypothetical protein